MTTQGEDVYVSSYAIVPHALAAEANAFAGVVKHSLRIPSGPCPHVQNCNATSGIGEVLQFERRTTDDAHVDVPQRTRCLPSGAVQPRPW